MDKLSATEAKQLLKTLRSRFDLNMQRHEKTSWSDVLQKLEESYEKLLTIFKMEQSGGEPDVVAMNPDSVTFIDCAPESPSGRRSLCYDEEALDSRKDNKPASSAAQMAKSIGIEILTEAQYRKLQTFGAFDLKTSSWISTPERIRDLGGALFCDRRYDSVFTYHNGAGSYYASRGFRGILEI